MHSLLIFQCAKKLLERERLTIEDYRVSRGLTRACRDDIRQYKCREDTSHRREFRLAQILLCLENSIHNGVCPPALPTIIFLVKTTES